MERAFHALGVDTCGKTKFFFHGYVCERAALSDEAYPQGVSRSTQEVSQRQNPGNYPAVVAKTRILSVSAVAIRSVL